MNLNNWPIKKLLFDEQHQASFKLQAIDRLSQLLYKVCRHFKETPWCSTSSSPPNGFHFKTIKKLKCNLHAFNIFKFDEKAGRHPLDCLVGPCPAISLENSVKLNQFTPSWYYQPGRLPAWRTSSCGVCEDQHKIRLVLPIV